MAATTLAKVLRDIEAALGKNYPRRLDELAKPASAKSLAALEKAAGTALPADLLAFYRWRGGGAGFFTDADTDDGSDGWDWSTPEAVIADHRIWSKLAPKGWKPTWLPIFSNGAGDNVCLDLESGRLVTMLHETPTKHDVIAESLVDGLGAVLDRIKRGRWRGAPESKQVTRIIAKLKKSGVDLNDLFGNEVYRLLESDPRACLGVVAVAEELKLAPALVLEFRARAELALGDADAALATYRRYVAAILEAGSVYNPPFRALRDGFAKSKKADAAFEVGEALEMNQAKLFEAWLSARLPKSERKEAMQDVVDLADATINGTDPEEEVRGWMGFGMSEKDARAKVAALVASGSLGAKEGPDLARACAAKAAALEALGQTDAAKPLWQRAAEADARVAAFWRSFGR